MMKRSSVIRLKEALSRSFEVLTDVMPTFLDVIPFPLVETSHWIDRIIITGRYCLWLLFLQLLQFAAIRRGVRHRDSACKELKLNSVMSKPNCQRYYALSREN